MQCCCELRRKEKDSDKPWVRCMGEQIPDSPFCDGCVDRHADKTFLEVRVRVDS